MLDWSVTINDGVRTAVRSSRKPHAKTAHTSSASHAIPGRKLRMSDV